MARGLTRFSALERSERLTTAIARARCELAASHELHCAIFEFRDLPKGIEHRVGEQIRRRFVKAERDENGTTRRSVIGACIKRYEPPTRFGRDNVAGARADRLEVQR